MKRCEEMTQRGFLLLETVIVVGIMAVAGAFILPRAIAPLEQRMNVAWLEQEAQLMAEDIRYMEQLAMNYRRVNSTFPSATSDSLPYMEVRSDGYRLIQGDRIIRRRTFAADEGVSVSRNRSRLEYEANSANTATVGLTRKGVTRYVIVDREGRVRISQTKPD